MGVNTTKCRRRPSEREPTDALRDKFNLIGGWFPSLTYALGGGQVLLRAGAVSANCVQAAPATLAKTIAAGAMAKGATANVSTLTLATGASTYNNLRAWQPKPKQQQEQTEGEAQAALLPLLPWAARAAARFRAKVRLQGALKAELTAPLPGRNVCWSLWLQNP